MAKIMKSARIEPATADLFQLIGLATGFGDGTILDRAVAAYWYGLPAEQRQQAMLHLTEQSDRLRQLAERTDHALSDL